MSSDLRTAGRLNEVILNKRWLLFSEPFKHLIARDVFVPQVYGRLEKAFQAVLEKGLSDQVDGNKFSRNMPGYDAYGVAIPQEPPFDVLLSQEMHDALSHLFEINCTGDLAGSLHTHRAGSRSGFIHNDLNPAWFPSRKPNDRTVLYNPSAYEFGGRPQGRQQNANERTVIRAISVLYYLNNQWSPGDGGETGLYASMDQDAHSPTVRVPPLNNLMMAFECTPFSYHSFISNVRHPRNTIIFWLHRTYDDAANQWGEQNFVLWDK